jgi:hypothetical protein
LWHTEKVGILRVLLLSLCAIVASGCKSDIGGGGVVDAGGPDGATILPMIDAALPDAAPPCVEGDLQGTDPASGNCYWAVYTAPQLAGDANAQCQAANGHLVTITSQGENAFVNALAIDAYEASLAATPETPVVDYTMGGTDAPPATEGVFEWITGENFAFTNWRTGEPNDNGPGEEGEDCSVIEGDNGGTWDDRNCTLSGPFGYICERE